MTANIHWLGHDSFRIDGEGLVIYLDPYKLKEGPKADLILITHDHQDHASPADVAKIQKPDTVIVTIAKAAEKLTGEIKTVKPGDELTVKGVKIKAVPAYNVNKFRSPGVPFHPKEAGHVGYVLTVKGVRIYHTGDSDFIPEMKGLAPDVAFAAGQRDLCHDRRGGCGGGGGHPAQGRHSHARWGRHRVSGRRPAL